MAAKKDSRIEGKYCVAGGPGLVSCKNTSEMEGISTHLFPKDEAMRAKWERFVRKHRANFKATKWSVLCSVHFEPTCFTRRLDINVDQGDRKKRRLYKDAVPTIDVAERTPPQEQSERERRLVKQELYYIFIVLIAFCFPRNCLHK